RRHRHEVRLAVRRDPNHGQQDRRRHLPSPGRLLVRQRELLHQPNGQDDQVLLRIEVTTRSSLASRRGFCRFLEVIMANNSNKKQSNSTGKRGSVVSTGNVINLLACIAICVSVVVYVVNLIVNAVDGSLGTVGT